MSPTPVIPSPGSKVRLLKDVVISDTNNHMQEGTEATVVISPNRSMKNYCWVKGPATNRNTATVRLLHDEWTAI